MASTVSGVPIAMSAPARRSGRHAARRTQVGGLQTRQVVAGRVIAQTDGRLARHGGGGAQRLDRHRPARRHRSAPPAPRRDRSRPASRSRSTISGAAAPRRSRYASRAPARATAAAASGSDSSQAGRLGTPTIGRSSATASPLATLIPTRRPVNEPGPMPTASALTAREGAAIRRQQRGDARQQLVRLPLAGAPAVDASQRRRPDRPGRWRRRSEADSMATITRPLPAPSAASAVTRRHAPASAGCAIGHQPAPAAMTISSRSCGSQPVEASAHSTTVTPVGLPLVEQAGRQRLLRLAEAVGVDVEEAQPAVVLVHEDEGGAVDDRLARPVLRPRPWPAASCRRRADRSGPAASRAWPRGRASAPRRGSRPRCGW